MKATILLLCMTSFLQAKAQCGEKEIRLQGGRLEIEGRVEVCLNGSWSTVCDIVWGGRHARVACRQLGYSEDDATAFKLAYFGRGILSTPVHIIGRCNGQEEKLAYCGYQKPNVSIGNQGNCINHCRDAGVRCRPFIPQNVTTAATGTNVTISWRPPALAQSMNERLLYLVVCSAKISNATNDYKVETRMQEITMPQLLPSTAYNCCVAIGAYIQNFTDCSSITTGESAGTSSNCSAVGGVLGTLTVILVLLLIGVIVCVAIYWKKIKASDQACKPSTRNSDSLEQGRTWHNPLYDAQNTEAPPLYHEVPASSNPSYGARPLNAEIQGPQENPSSNHYSALGPAYESVKLDTATGAEGQDYSVLRH